MCGGMTAARQRRRKLRRRKLRPAEAKGHQRTLDFPLHCASADGCFLFGGVQAPVAVWRWTFFALSFGTLAGGPQDQQWMECPCECPDGRAHDSAERHAQDPTAAQPKRNARHTVFIRVHGRRGTCVEIQGAKSLAHSKWKRTIQKTQALGFKKPLF